MSGKVGKSVFSLISLKGSARDLHAKKVLHLSGYIGNGWAAPDFIDNEEVVVTTLAACKERWNTLAKLCVSSSTNTWVNQRLGLSNDWNVFIWGALLQNDSPTQTGDFHFTWGHYFQ